MVKTYRNIRRCSRVGVVLILASAAVLMPPLAVAATYLTIARQWRAVDGWKALAGALVYLLIAAPWFAAVELRYPTFLHYAFLEENLQRHADDFRNRLVLHGVDASAGGLHLVQLIGHKLLRLGQLFGQRLVVVSFGKDPLHITVDPDVAAHKATDLTDGFPVDLTSGLDMPPWSWRIVELH